MPAIALSSRRGRSAVRAAFLPAVILLASACGDSVPATAPPSLNKGGKPGGSAESPVVTRTSPASADRGLTLEVRVLGDGFDDGSLAEWAFQGVVDPAQVRTNSTRFVSARELLANITISSEAVLGLYDVQVTTTKGKKGVAIEAFEVTLATECGSRTTNLDSRAMLQWDGSLAIVGDEGNAPYRGGEGGVHAKIFYHNAVCSRSGDAVFDPDMNGGATRKLIFRFPAGHVTGLSGDVAVGPFVNFFAIMQLGSDVNGDGAVTSGRDAKIHAKYPGSVLSLEYHATTAEWPGYTHGIHPRIRFQSTGIKECEALEYDRVRATRTLGTFVPTGQHASDGLALGEWLVSVMGEWVIESVGASADGSGPHLAQCFRKQGSSLVPNGSQIHMPFRVTLKEFRP